MDRLLPLFGPNGPISTGWRGRWDARHAIGAANTHSPSGLALRASHPANAAYSGCREKDRAPLTADPRRRYVTLLLLKNKLCP